VEETRGWEQEARQWAAFIALELLPSNDVAALLEVRFCGSKVHGLTVPFADSGFWSRTGFVLLSGDPLLLSVD
jgi:hypothetical protein